MDNEKVVSGFKRMCVFCGSSSGNKAIYSEVAEQLGNELVRRGIDLVYGGGSIGLMGKVAQAVQDAGGHVVGVIPRALMPKEVCGKTVGDLVAVDDMHQRKAEMARRADAFIALPGGFGTLEEVLEIMTWAQLGIHRKPVGLLNVDGYYDAMLSLFDKALSDGFLNVASHSIVVSAPTPSDLLDKLQVYTPTDDKTVPRLTWEITTGVPAQDSLYTTTSRMSSRSAQLRHPVNLSHVAPLPARAFASITRGRGSKTYVNGIRGSGLLQQFQPPKTRRSHVYCCPRSIFEFSGTSFTGAKMYAPAAPMLFI